MRLNLGLTESEEMIKKAALDFMRRDANKETIQALLDTDTGYTAKLWGKVVEMGWLGIIIPEDYGGTDNLLTSAGVLFEALGTGPVPGPYFSSGILASSVILAAGNEEQKQRILPAIAEGKNTVTLALTEPRYSWTPESIQTTALKITKQGHIIKDRLHRSTVIHGKRCDRGTRISHQAGVYSRTCPVHKYITRIGLGLQDYIAIGGKAKDPFARTYDRAALSGGNRQLGQGRKCFRGSQIRASAIT